MRLQTIHYNTTDDNGTHFYTLVYLKIGARFYKLYGNNEAHQEITEDRKHGLFL